MLTTIYLFKVGKDIQYTSDNKVFHEYMSKDGYEYTGVIRVSKGGSLTSEASVSPIIGKN